MTKTANLILFSAIVTILITGVSYTDSAFAQNGSPNGQPFQQLEQRISALEDSAARADSFFDAFFDVFTVDSFFDVFTALQTDVSELHSQTEDINIEIGELQEKTTDNMQQIQQNADDIGTIQTEIVALDLRGQSCDVGDVVTGINPDGAILCAPDQTGGLGDIQAQIDAKTAEIAQIGEEILQTEQEISALQIQLDELALPETEVLQCLQECSLTKQQLEHDLQTCSVDAANAGLNPEVECASEQNALDNFSCDCATTSDPGLAEELQQQIDSLNDELDELNDELQECEFDLRILQTLQNQFG